jgi:integrase
MSSVRAASKPIPPAIRGQFFDCVWDLAWGGSFFRVSMPGEQRLFERFGRGSESSHRHGLVLLWLMAGAFRFNEIARLRFDQVDWLGSTVQVQRSKNGLNPSRTIDRNLIDATLAWRKRFSIASELVLPNRSGAELSCNVFNRDVMGPLGELFGIKLSTHSMRDTASQELLRIAEQRGLGIKAVQESLGHRNLNSTETYLRKQKVGEICIDLSTIGAITE